MCEFHINPVLLQALNLLEVHEGIDRDMTTFTQDRAPIKARRDRIALTITKLSVWTP